MADDTSLAQQVRDRLLTGEPLDVAQIKAEYGLHPGTTRSLISRMKARGYRFEQTKGPGPGNRAMSVYRLVGQPSGSADGNPKRPGPAAGKPNKTQRVRDRLLAGETLDRLQAKIRYGLDPSVFDRLARDLKAAGHPCTQTRVGKRPTAYRFLTAAEQEEAAPSVTNGSRPAGAASSAPYDIIRERLLAGEQLAGAEMAEELGCPAQIVSVVMARLKEEGYDFDHVMAGKRKRWFVSGKGAPRPRRLPSRGTVVGPSRNGQRPRMPVPQLDAPTECVMAFRVDDDNVQFAVRQGSRVFTAQLISVVEAD